MCWSWSGAGLDTGHGHYTVSGPIICRERGGGRRLPCTALLPLQDEQSQMCRKCDTASSLHPPCARALHRTWSHPAAARWPSEAGRWWRGVRLEAGTMLGLMGRGDTAAGGMLATVCGHSVEMWRGGICAVCCESVDTSTRDTAGL